MKGGVQSVEIGMQILATLADRGGEETLGALARATSMPAAKAHRYLASLIKAGFVERNLGKYVLGPQALRVGLVALGRLDVVEIVTPALYELRDKIDGTVMLALWGETGPTIVRWIESMRPVTVNVRVGSVMPLIRSATGQVFGAFLPETMTRTLLIAELATAKKQNLDIRTLGDARAMFSSVHENGLGHTAGAVLSGVLGLAAPIFDHNGSLAAVISCLGPAAPALSRTEIGGLEALVGQQRRRGSFGDQASAVENIAALGKAQRRMRVLIGEQDCCPGIAQGGQYF
jgi:DNA-binding IclR family transcriptional regulator